MGGKPKTNDTGGVANLCMFNVEQNQDGATRKPMVPLAACSFDSFIVVRSLKGMNIMLFSRPR